MNRGSAAILAIIGLCLFHPGGRAQEGLSVGVRAPDFTLPASADGRMVSLSAYAGKSPVILHFWKSR